MKTVPKWPVGSDLGELAPRRLHEPDLRRQGRGDIPDVGRPSLARVHEPDEMAPVAGDVEHRGIRVDEPPEVRDDLAPDRILLAHFAFVEPNLVQLGQGAGRRPALEHWAPRAGRVGHRAEVASGGAANDEPTYHRAVSSRPRSSVNCGVQRSIRRIFSMLTTRRRMLSMSRRSTCWMSIDVPRARRSSPRGVDRRLDPGADVEDLALGARMDGRQQRRVDRIVDVRVVARLLPVAVDGHRAGRHAPRPGTSRPRR